MQKKFCWLSVDCRLILCRHTVDRPIGRPSTDCRQRYAKESINSDRLSVDTSTDSRPTIDRQSTDYRPTVGRCIDRQSVDSRPTGAKVHLVRKMYLAILSLFLKRISHLIHTKIDSCHSFSWGVISRVNRVVPKKWKTLTISLWLLGSNSPLHS